MDPTALALIIAALAVALAIGLAAALLRRGRRAGDAAAGLAAGQAELAGRLAQMAESQAATQNRLAERLQAQERTLAKALEQRLAELGRRVGDTLNQSTTKNAETMADLRARLAVIDAAQKNIAELSTQVVALQDILSNKQARGAFGEIQLQDLVRNALPPSAYEFQVTLSNGRRADCLLELPNPPGPIVIDAKFPLSNYHALRNAEDDATRKQAGRQFAADVVTHVQDIAEKYILHGETAESALMFLPSEAVYAELHANFPDTIEKSYRARGWIVSPTTLMATLNTVRAVLRDAKMREQAGAIQKEVRLMLEDVTRLGERIEKLERHFGQADRDLRDLRISADKVIGRGERIERIELGDETPAEALPGAAPPALTPDGGP
jgi:DNA recombination protein RmuC